MSLFKGLRPFGVKNSVLSSQVRVGAKRVPRSPLPPGHLATSGFPSGEKYTEGSWTSQGFVRCNRTSQLKNIAPPMAWRRSAENGQSPAIAGCRAGLPSRLRGLRHYPDLTEKAGRPLGLGVARHNRPTAIGKGNPSRAPGRETAAVSFSKRPGLLKEPIGSRRSKNKWFSARRATNRMPTRPGSNWCVLYLISFSGTTVAHLPATG